MKKVSAETGYTCDPHGAVGYAALEDELKGDEIGIFLETAHPAKFKATVEQYIGKEVEIPARLQKFMDGEKKSIAIKADFNLLQVK